MKSNLSYIKKPELFEELSRHQSHFFGVIDSKVRDHLPDWMNQSPNVFWIHDPEGSKNLETFGKASSFFLDRGVDRNSTLIAIGGGATTDLGGYIASSLLRGIKWISVPTTLLAMVDGSIGGKVGLNMPQGKNQLGAFHAPSDVLICNDFLVTLPEAEWISGKGEILKYAFLSSKIHDLILNNADMEMISFECALYKKQTVEDDFKETGDRIFLNFGHTLGHAFESSLKISHGVAVAMGIRYLLKLLNQIEQLTEWNKLTQALGLPVDKLSIRAYPEFSVEKFKNYLLQDKKKAQDSMRLVLVKEVGKPFVQDMPLSELVNKIEGFGDFKN